MCVLRQPFLNGGSHKTSLKPPFSTAPSASPTDFTVNAVATAVCLTWNPPPEDQHNGALTTYTLTCAGVSNYVQAVKAHVRSFCFNNRVRNQELSCSMTASTAAGTGLATVAITATTGGVQTHMNTNVQYLLWSIFQH